MVGPTMVSMELLLDVTTKQMSLAFVGAAIGFTCGSMLTGSITYD